MTNKLKILSKTSLFAGIPPEQLDKVGRIAEKRHFRKGEIIFTENQEGAGFYVVASGMVKVFKVSMEGKEQILHIFGPGEPIGEVPVFTDKAYPANAEAIAESHLLFFPKSAFVNLIAKNPSLSLRMLAVLSMRLRQFTVQIENLSLKEVPGRLAGYLLYLAEENQIQDRVELTISKGHLASLLGTIPETLSRVFGKMSRDNIIAVKGRDIRLLDTEKLEALAGYGLHINGD
jgi:CRP/FNR family transcriptional regulator, dissimilatory nitrate respiration regulator